MSRVEDDRDAARVAARLAEQKRTEEGKKQEKANANNAFSKLVGKQQQQAKVAYTQQHEASTAQKALAQLLAEAKSSPQSESAQHSQHALQHQEKAATQGRLGQESTKETVRQGTDTANKQGQDTKLKSDVGTAEANAGRASDQAALSHSSESRVSDSRKGNEAIDERKEASDSSKASHSAGSARSEKGDLKADSDKGGGGGNQGQKDDGNKGNPMMQPGFRYNPALGAPVSVAKPKEASGSERLKKIANELAQKIVERVRVGTNAAGKMEFQIDLRNDVLSGLTVKVSSHNGRIKAVFSGNDRDVLKMIEEHGEALQNSLSARGLTLEDLKFEDRS
jgi:hypothetical protein